MSRTLCIGSLLRAIVLAPPCLGEPCSPRLPTERRTPVRVSCRRPSVDEIARNGRITLESVDDLPRNQWTLWIGMRGRLASEYALGLIELSMYRNETGEHSSLLIVPRV